MFARFLDGVQATWLEIKLGSFCLLCFQRAGMAHPVGSLSEEYGSRIGKTEDSLILLERNRSSEDPWEMVETKPNIEALERGIPGLYFSCYDMLLTEEATWLLKVSESSPTLAIPMNHTENLEAPEQCPIIDSQEQGLSPGLVGQEEERSLEQVQSMVVGEVLKDIETACKLLNITPGRLCPPPHPRTTMPVIFKTQRRALTLITDKEKICVAHVLQIIKYWFRDL